MRDAGAGGTIFSLRTIVASTIKFYGVVGTKDRWSFSSQRGNVSVKSKEEYDGYGRRNASR